MRTTLAALLVAGLGFAPQAFAIDDPYMWGVGPRIGTMVIPGKYPITFPTSVERFDFLDNGNNATCNPNSNDPDHFFENGDPMCENERRDVDDDGIPRYHTLNEVRGDLNLGGDFVFYLNKGVRFGAMTQVGFGLGEGKRWFDISVMPKVDKILLEDQVDIYAGGGIGFGYQKFGGTTSTEKLKIPYFPLRVELGAMARTDTAAFQLGIYGQSSVPGNQVYVTSDGTSHESVGTPLALFSYLSAGLEFTTYFGDFDPPKKDGGGKKGGKKGGKGGGGGGKGGGKGGGGKGGGGR